MVFNRKNFSRNVISFAQSKNATPTNPFHPGKFYYYHYQQSKSS